MQLPLKIAVKTTKIEVKKKAILHDFFNFLRIVSKHHRKVLNGVGMFFGHQRVVFDHK